MSKIIDFLTRSLRSSKFIWFVLGFFLLQGSFFALAVDPSYPEYHNDGNITRGGGVVPDGNRHIAAIYYFAERPILTAPFITDQAERELWMGDLERFPSYFYYYLLSFPVRLATAFSAPDWVVVLVIRFVGLAIGLLALWVFYKLIRELKAGQVVANVSTLALALTGSFAYLAPAENYDVSALTMFLLFMLTSIKLFTRNDGKQIYWMAVWFFLGSITKYTYLPFMGLVGLIALVIYLRRNSGWWLGWQILGQQLKTWWQKSNKFIVAGLIALLLVAGGLFAERIGGNLVKYQAFNPKCDIVHSHEACMANGVYSRNYNRAKALEEGTAQTRHSYSPVRYTTMWLDRYYASMYAYLGHIWIYQFWSVMYVGLYVLLAAVVAMYGYLRLKRHKVLVNTQQKLIAVTAVVFVVAQYLFNVRTYINFEGMTYAHQGRYLLPMIGFLYVLLVMVAVKFVQVVSARQRRIVTPILLAVLLLTIATNSALPVWFAHAEDNRWYSEPFKFLAD